jgi:2-amino-4-hydroxy-6-hydroxymethyldihydropteridine diphosphokinase
MKLIHLIILTELYMNLFLGLGSDLGDRKVNIREAIVKVGEKIGPVVSVSSIYETEPWGFKSGNNFLNIVIICSTELSVKGILARILEIEAGLGRIRTGKGYESRIIDIDILFCDELIINYKSLIIPHPKISERRFVLVPLAEVAPDLIHPVLQKSAKELLSECEDVSKVVLTGILSTP